MDNPQKGERLDEDEAEAILQNSNSVQEEGEPTQERTLAGELMQKLDKILAVLLIILLVMFFLQSAGTDTKRKKFTKQSLGLTTQPKLDSKSKSTIVNDTSSSGAKHGETEGKKMKPSLQDLIRQIEDDDLKDESSKNNANPSSENPEVPDNEESQSEESNSEKVQNEKTLVPTKYQPHRRRSRSFKQKEKMEYLQLLKLSRYNLDDPEVTEAEKKKDFEEETKKLEAKYQMSDFDDELSMCVVIHASAHKKNYAHEYVLNSIFNQNYSEYIVVYIADGFDADEVQPIKEFIKKKDRFKQNVKLVWNNEKKYFLESTITAIRAFCMEKRVTVLMDGDDELLGSQVFNVINTFYRKYNLNMAYGNFIEYHETQEVMRIGFSTEYEDTEKRDNSYRSVGQKFGSVKTFKTRLVSFIKESDLKDSTGGYYKYAGDYALLYPLLQLSCGQVRYIPEHSYLYFGYEIDPTYGSMQISNGRAIRQKPRYDCFKKYK